ncbi:hypothetical protein [Niallia nealsonii]|uniref:hypothetical protein n=1 Tax=Niallia nealsonii TaxID=115979 RepID=UPI0012FE9BDC|nr:hypothetical protein [Niallia nealsonii]
MPSSTHLLMEYLLEPDLNTFLKKQSILRVQEWPLELFQNLHGRKNVHDRKKGANRRQ